MPRRPNRTFPSARYPHPEQPRAKPVDRRPNNFSDGSGSHMLGDHILPLVRIECQKCGRRGQYSTAKLLAKYGPYQQMVELRWLLSKCTRKSYDDYCGALFTDARWMAGLTDERVPAWAKPTPPQLGRPWRFASSREPSTPPQLFAN